jgi:spermidine/putrescine-binding protein
VTNCRNDGRSSVAADNRSAADLRNIFTGGDLARAWGWNGDVSFGQCLRS